MAEESWAASLDSKRRGLAKAWTPTGRQTGRDRSFPARWL